MRHVRMMAGLIAMAAFLAAAGAFAQHEQHQATPPPGPKAGAAMPGMPGMGMGTCPMCQQHQEVKAIADQLQTSFTALQNEMDPATLRRKLEEHGVLLKQLQAKTQAAGPMMAMGGGSPGNMQGQMTCPMMTGEQK